MDLQKEAAILEQKPDDATEKGKKNRQRRRHPNRTSKRAKQRAKKQAKIAVAQNLLKAGASIEVIVKITSFSVDDIKKPQEGIT